MKAKTYPVLFCMTAILLLTACEGIQTFAPKAPQQTPKGPYIESLNPTSGAPGIQVTIKGQNFNSIVGIQWVTFGGKTAEGVSWSDTEIVVIVPYGTGTVDVSTSGPSLKSNSTTFIYNSPHIDSITPPFAEPGARVLVKGTDFGVKGISPSFWVKFGNSLAFVQPSEWTDKELVVTVPADYGMGIEDARIVAALLSIATTGKTGLPEELQETVNALARLLGIDLSSLQLREDDPWWIALGKIVAAIGIPGAKVHPEGSMDVAVVVRTPAGESEAAVFAYQLPFSESPQTLPAPTVQVIDSLGDVGKDTSIAFNRTGNPAISYSDATNQDLKFAEYDGASWHIQTVDSAGSVGTASSLAFDPAGNPAIAYYDSGNKNLKYAQRNGATWNIVTLNQAYWSYKNSLSFDASGKPVIAYYDYPACDLKYTTYLDGIRWNVVTVYDDGRGTGWGRTTSLALDLLGRPAIAFRDPKLGLRYAAWNGSTWTVETIDGGYGTGASASLRFDSLGNLSIAYGWQGSYEGPVELRFARLGGKSWSVQTVENDGQNPSLSFDLSGNPAASYYSGASGDLKYAYWNGSGWKVETVDNVGDVGQSSSLAFNGNGVAVISYYDVTNGDLKVAWLPQSWVSGGTATPVPSQTIAWGKSVSPQFKVKVIEISKRLGMDVAYLMAAMAFETGGTFDPSIRNVASGATGLIQFLPSTAKNLGTSTDALGIMSAVEQLDYVEKYFQPYGGKLNTLEDVYMAILWPRAIGQQSDYVLFEKPAIYYQQNSGLDLNGDGKVTRQEASAKVRDRLIEGLTSRNVG